MCGSALDCVFAVWPLQQARMTPVRAIHSAGRALRVGALTLTGADAGAQAKALVNTGLVADATKLQPAGLWW